MERVRAYLISVAFLVAVGAPGFRDADDDGFPLSTYPMFAHARARVNDVTGAVAIDAEGHARQLPPRFVANSEAMLAVATLQRAVDAGPAATRALCARIAERVAQAGTEELKLAQRVEIVTQRVDAIDFLGGRAPTGKGRVRARCPVAVHDGAAR